MTRKKKDEFPEASGEGSEPEPTPAGSEEPVGRQGDALVQSTQGQPTGPEVGDGSEEAVAVDVAGAVADSTEPDGNPEPGDRPANEGPSDDAEVSEPDDRDEDEDAWDEEVETVYEQTATGHRVTRRVTRRKTSRTTATEEFEEDVTEVTSESLPGAGATDLPPTAYQAPPTTAHPAPVG